LKKLTNEQVEKKIKQTNKKIENEIKSIIGDFEKFSEIDLLVVQMITDNFERLSKAKEIIAAEGMIIREGVFTRMHPAMQIIKESEKNIMQHIDKLSINPKERLRVKYIFEKMNFLQLNSKNDDDVKDQISNMFIKNDDED
jgi:phage terminase small subunit